MSDVSGVEQNLHTVVTAVQEGEGFVEAGHTERLEVVALYAGLIAALDGVMSRVGEIDKRVRAASEFAQVGGEKIGEGVRALLDLGSENEELRHAITSYRMAGHTASSGPGSMVANAEAQYESLEGVVGGVEAVRRYVEAAARLAADEGYVDAIRLRTAQGHEHIRHYAEQIGVTPPTVQ